MSVKSLTGGDDGISFAPPPVLTFGDVAALARRPDRAVLRDPSGRRRLLRALRLIVHSPLGVRFMAVRENDRRAALIGINVYLTRLSRSCSPARWPAFRARCSRSSAATHRRPTCSTTCPAKRWSGPSSAAPAALLGPLFGTGLLIIFREVVSTVWEHYLFAVGAITILVVMFAPRGLAGVWNDLLAALTRRAAA